MNDLDLASLVVSRVCHDLISPVGAIVNGLEVIADDDDPELRTQALALIARSAAQASAKLQFARLAYGASGSRGDILPIGDVREVARLLFADSKVSLDWKAEEIELPKAFVRALANLVMLGQECLPRGGVVTVLAENSPNGVQLVVKAQGQGARLAEDQRAALMGETTLETVESRAMCGFVLGLLLRGFGETAKVESNPDLVTFRISHIR
ncbi:MAG: histidine phosphotransferase [Alphaproteobacteria bacterium]|nr:histidine phosphotransferase [Alphaproteobacteria bacterium]